MKYTLIDQNCTVRISVLTAVFPVKECTSLFLILTVETVWVNLFPIIYEYTSIWGANRAKMTVCI